MRPITLIFTLILAGCTSYGGTGLRPGESRLADVEALMGQPAMRWKNGDGSVQLAYPRGPAGYQTFMVYIGPDGRLQCNVNVLNETGLARIGPGMTKEQVLRVLGPPDYSRTVYFKARDELVWDWRFCPYTLNTSHMLVLFDGTSGTVRTTGVQPIYPGRAMTEAHCSR